MAERIFCCLNCDVTTPWNSVYHIVALYGYQYSRNWVK